MREYRFNYTYDTYTRLLSSVVQYGKNGVSGGVAFPPTEFAYTVFNNTKDEWHGHDYPYSRLTSVENGYGGDIAVTYQQMTVNDMYGYHYRVQERQTADGLGRVSRVVYGYGPSCYDATDTPCDDGFRHWNLKGYEWSDRKGVV